MTTELDFRNLNALWASVLVETLARSGVRHAVISPGSRSTPLTVALARHARIESVPALDERSAAFFALGLAKVSLRPVVLVCTSGTAGANYFPAVIEARESAVPLLVLTADRPPELRASASGQTIDQQKLYGSYANFFHELTVPELDVGLFRYLRQTVRNAVAQTRMPQPGPVHLNLPFRDPLAPVNDEGRARAFGERVDWDRFFATLDPITAPAATASEPPAETASAKLPPDARGVIVVGPSQPEDPASFAAAIGELARRLRWPVLAEGLSPVRNHAANVPTLVTTYDAILRSASAARRLAPEVVFCVGGWPTSKVLRGWLEAHDPLIWLAAGRFDNRDALHGRTRACFLDLPALAASFPARPGGGYERSWNQHEQKARATLDDRLQATSELIEPKAAWVLARHLPDATPLFIANSMPVRDVEYVWPAAARGVRPLCNRGANGIDGTLSSALGVAHGSGRPTVLLTGDLALLHDTNGFLLRSVAKGSLTIVLINNRGGGIFEHLPIAQFDPPFEKFFATPPDVDFGKLCATYGVEHVLVPDWARFTALVSTLPETGIRVLELRTDRKRDVATRRHWFAEVAAALGAGAEPTGSPPAGAPE